jgi:predicted dehydrogenase
MVRVALIGAGAVAVQNHIPGIRSHPQGQVVALCDSDPKTLARAALPAGIQHACTDYSALLARGDVDAVIIATPNDLHGPIALAAIAAGKHVLCEKPLAMDRQQAETMANAAERAGIVNMTAFTYRFVPAIRWMKRLIADGALGVPYHIRIHRLQDWGSRALGWRQEKARCGSGELADMLAHRIDYVHYLVGGITRLVAHTKQCLAERRRPDGSMQPSDVEDWVAMLADVDGGVTAVLESTKMATGRGSGNASEDYVEINGSDATLVYHLEHPHELLVGHPGSRLEATAVPDDLLVAPGSSRDPRQGDPLQAFRYDQGFEFVEAIVKRRPASPDFRDGARVQAVLDAVLRSAAMRQWVEMT